MKDFDNDNFKKLKEKLSKEKGTISKCDFAESINKIVTSAIGAMVFSITWIWLSKLRL